MKTILKILTLLIFISCKAQTLTPLYNDGTSPNDGIHASRYYKDVDNDYDPYVGTWSGTLGNAELTIIFNKVTNHFSGGQTYSDILVGEYQYKENGVLLVDTYPDLMIDNGVDVPNIVNQDPWQNNIASEGIKTDNRGIPPCAECAPNTRFIILGIADPTRTNIDGKIRMARFVENGIEKIRMRINKTFVDTQGVSSANYTGLRYLTIPENSIWTFTKVE